MVFLLVVLTIILFIGIEFYLHRRKIKQAQREGIKNPALSEALQLVSPGTYLQPTMTWGKILDTGNLMLGLQPLLVGLTGNPDKLELLAKGKQIKKGEALLRLQKDSRYLDIISPVDGEVIAANPEAHKQMSWDKLGQNWIYTIKPKNLSSEIPGWIIAEKIKPWLNERYQSIKSFFQKQLSSAQLGETMADGGELPIGILMKFEEPIWREFNKAYLARS
jgi:glycine cleavage system H lipoate-binding protein